MIATKGAMPDGDFKVNFEYPKEYKHISGLPLGYAAQSAVNKYNPGRGTVDELCFKPKV
jgi:hypothetical protein